MKTRRCPECEQEVEVMYARLYSGKAVEVYVWHLKGDEPCLTSNTEVIT